MVFLTTNSGLCSTDLLQGVNNPKDATPFFSLRCFSEEGLRKCVIKWSKMQFVKENLSLKSQNFMYEGGASCFKFAHSFNIINDQFFAAGNWLIRQYNTVSNCCIGDSLGHKYKNQKSASFTNLDFFIKEEVLVIEVELSSRRSIHSSQGIRHCFEMLNTSISSEKRHWHPHSFLISILK